MVRTTIQIAEVSNTNGRIAIKGTDKKTYSFFQTKKSDGLPTKALEGFQKIQPKIGESVVAMVDEKDAVSSDGTPIVYRNISYFLTDQETIATAQSHKPIDDDIPTINIPDEDEPTAKSETLNDTMRMINDLASRITSLESRMSVVEHTQSGINPDEVPF